MFHHGSIQCDVCSHAEDLGKVIDWMRDEDRRLKTLVYLPCVRALVALIV